ncbi:hypothetical protein BL257_05635 [Escherichia coli str. K-12 substr. W3110]|nr:hypothetical protein BL257_05635 [Escherichia coli str. K-12 substr. W3110]
MKLKKLPGFSLGLIALAVGNAYATQLLDDYSIISYMTDEESPIEIKDNNPISNGEYLTTEDESHAVKVDDGVTGYINNASVMTSGDGSYGISVDSQNKVLYISDSDWICPYISRHLLSLNPLQARCRRYSRGER